MNQLSLRYAARSSVWVGVLAMMLTVSGAALANDGKGVFTDGVNTPYETITSAGPLDQIFVGEDVSTQISYITDPEFQVYPSTTIPGDYGTFVVVNNELYAPDFSNHGGTATSGIGAHTVLTHVSQSGVTGAGTSGDPYSVTTVMDVGTTGLQLTQVDSYVVSEERYRTDVSLANSGSAAVNGILYRAMDCYLAGDDASYGMQSGSSVGCSANPNNNPMGRIELLEPITGGNNYYQASFSEVWSAIGFKQPFNDTCRCDEFLDTGAGISWDFTVPAGGSVVYSHYSVFSPTGGPPAQEEAIPTLNPFGTAVFVGLLVVIGVFVLRRWS